MKIGLFFCLVAVDFELSLSNNFETFLSDAVVQRIIYNDSIR